MNETHLKLSWKKNGVRGPHSALIIQAPLKGLDLRISRLGGLLFIQKGFQLTQPSQWLLTAPPPPRNPRGTDLTSSLVSGDVGLDLPNHIWSPEWRKAT